MSAKKKYEYVTFDSAPDTDLYKGAHVRQYTSKLRKTVTGPSGEILYFVKIERKGETVWRALVAWRPEDAEHAHEHTDQFVDVRLLRLENSPPPPRKESEPNFIPSTPNWDAELDEDDTTCDCGGDLKFDPDLVGDTCGGLTRIGWNVCVKCGKGWLSDKGVPHEGKWKLASGDRSVETGNGRIRVDGCTKIDALMARIVKLPELELEMAQLRKRVEEYEHWEKLAKQSSCTHDWDGPPAGDQPLTCRKCGLRTA